MRTGAFESLDIVWRRFACLLHSMFSINFTNHFSHCLAMEASESFRLFAFFVYFEIFYESILVCDMVLSLIDRLQVFLILNESNWN